MTLPLPARAPPAIDASVLSYMTEARIAQKGAHTTNEPMEDPWLTTIHRAGRRAANTIDPPLGEAVRPVVNWAVPLPNTKGGA